MRNEVKLANPNYDSSKIEEFKNVWVFCEQRQGQMMSTSYELISEGRKLADELGVKLCGLLVGDNVGDLAESVGGYGADEVIVCDHRRLFQAHLRRHLRDEARGLPHRRDQHRP